LRLGEGMADLFDSHVLVAVSATSDPTGAWKLFSFDTSDDGDFGTPAHTGCPCLPDQPLVGANGDGLFISTNEFQLLPRNFPFNGAQIYAFSRTALETASSGSPPAFVHIDVGTVPIACLSVHWHLVTVRWAYRDRPSRRAARIRHAGCRTRAALDHAAVRWPAPDRRPATPGGSGQVAQGQGEVVGGVGPAPH
jgi:hypothetical protein